MDWSLNVADAPHTHRHSRKGIPVVSRPSAEDWLYAMPNALGAGQVGIPASGNPERHGDCFGFWIPPCGNDAEGETVSSPRDKVRHLSRGELAKLCLLLALAHRPPLLLLDEPSSGLDALARQFGATHCK